MRVLLDTHVALWALADDDRLGPRGREAILDPRIEVWVSSVSVWEIAIKFALGKASAPSISAEEALHAFRSAGFKLLPMTPEHAIEVERLPAARSDPFDRMLIAQARAEPMHFITADAKIVALGGDIIRI